ncbi:hypothetical protein PDL71_05295 [Lacibacter sp. MH-610]|uniref:hypothetical protein n=1 Tax=Lacibacter sp. MH-610 TaxID=3020883 RepID=UPI003892BDB7
MENLEEDELLIFIGEKIEIKKLPESAEPCTSTHCYDKFLAHYKVIEKICGNYRKNEITFLVDGYYEMPDFADYKNCLFYLSRKRNSKDTFTQLTWQYDEVYKTKSGEWASPFSAMNYMDYDSTKGGIKPHKIEYAEDVTYKVKGLSRQSLNRHFPFPYFTINNKVATAHYGNTVHELVQMKKEGLLKRWGYYGIRDTAAAKLKVQDVILDEWKQPEIIKYNENELKTTFYNFFEAFKRVDAERIRKMSMPNVICSVCEEPPRFDYENNFETIDSFIISAFRYLHYSQLEQEIENKNYKISAEKRDTSLNQDKKSDQAIIYKVSFRTIADIENNTVKYRHDFEFLKSNNTYLFYGLSTNIVSYYGIESRIRRGDIYFKKAN